MRRSPSTPPQVSTTFQDVAGLAEAKKEIWELVDFLKDPKKCVFLCLPVPVFVFVQILIICVTPFLFVCSVCLYTDRLFDADVIVGPPNNKNKK